MEANVENSRAAEQSAKPPLPKADKYIWALYIFLLVVSVVELYSASSREVTADNVFMPLLRHGRLLLIGVLVTVAVSRVRYKWIAKFTWVVVGGSILIALYVLFKGDIINGARRSTTLLGIPLQSAELLKFSVVLIVARIMSRNQVKGGVRTSGLVAATILVLACCGLLFSQGLTNTLLLLGIFFSMMIMAGVEWKKWMALIVAIGVIGAGAKLASKAFSHQDEQDRLAAMTTGRDSQGRVVTMDRGATHEGRIDRWMAQWTDTVPMYRQPITTLNRQEQYSYMAQANGGWHGRLPGNSREAARLPLAFSDYIYAIIVEDWGLIGGVVLLGAYLALLGRAGAVASKCRNVFPALLVTGMAVMIVLQALFHMAIVTGVLPVSGQPLPLISKGGSSILVTSLAFGLMLSVSRFAAMGTDHKAQAIEAAETPADLLAKNPTGRY